MAAGRDPAGLAFVLHTRAVVVDRQTPSARLSIAAEPARPRLDPAGNGPVGLTEGFDVPALLDEVRATMGTRETLAAGGLPGLRRDGDLTAAG